MQKREVLGKLSIMPNPAYVNGAHDRESNTIVDERHKPPESVKGSFHWNG